MLRGALGPKELGLLYDVKEDRLVFPIRHEGRIVDDGPQSIQAIAQMETLWKKWLAIHIRVW